MKVQFLIAFLASSIFCYSQKDFISIQFNPIYNSLPIALGKKYPYKTDSIEITTLKFYISTIQFYQENELVDEFIKKHFLIDIENPQSLILTQANKKNKKFNHIHFSIGVDSINNTAGALGDDLDPTNGMYWTWQSGYINFKLEGNSKLCPSRKNQFTFHIGGYQYPNNTFQNLDFKISNQNKIEIDFNIAQLFNQINLKELYEVMSPNKKAMEMATKIKAAFSITN